MAYFLYIMSYEKIGANASTQQLDISSTGDGANSIGLCVSLLGTFTLWLGQREIAPTAFSRRKALQLFKLILLQAGHKLHRDQVLDLLWPHLNPRSATAQLYKAVYQVRQALAGANPACPPDTLLELSDEIIRLTAPNGVHTDISMFEQLAREAIRSGDLHRLQQAAACYKGDLLPADRYEEWTLTYREALRERFIDVLVNLGRRYQKAGYLAEAADAFRQALDRDKVREDARCGLMRVYALQGSRTRALRQYQRCAEILDEELGVEPAPETTALHEQILDGQIRPVQPAPALSTLERPRLPPLIGRQAERKLLETLLERLAQGQGGVLALEGNAGIGKTRLAQEMLQMGAQRWTVLWGSTHEQEGQSPYQPFIEALRRAVRTDPTGAYLIPAELAVAIPELPAEVTPVATADRVAAQSALFAGVLRFLTARTARAPVILILDDLHAADLGTFKLFHYLARQTASMPLLLVGVWRTDEPDHLPILEQILGNLDRQGLLQQLALAPLSETEHRRLLEQTLEGGSVDPALAGELYRLSAGNPLFAQEMVRQLAADQKITLVEDRWQLVDERGLTGVPLPPSVQALVGSRLAILSPAALRMLQFAAVVGRDIPVPLLEGWSKLGEHRVLEPALLDVLDDAVAAGLLQEKGLSYSFAYPLFRQVIYQQMSNARRRALHGQAAAGLERAFQDDPTALPVEALAFHYQQSGDASRAINYLVQAGDRAEAVFDHDSALRRYQEALSLLEAQGPAESEQVRAGLHERIGDVHRTTGDVTGSLDAYRQALEVLVQGETPPDRNFQRILHRKITHAAILAPDVSTAAKHLEQAWALLAEDRLEKARMLITQALFDWHTVQLEAAIKHASQALKLAEREGATVEISQACEMLAMSHLPLGHWEEGLQYELRRQTPDWSPDIVVAVDAHLCLYQFRLQGAEPYQGVRRFIEQVAQKASSIGNLRCLAVCHYVLGSLAVLQGKPDVAVENLAESLALHRRIGSASSAAYTLARQAELMTAAGDPQAGWQRVQLGLEVAGQAAIRDHCLMLVHTAGIWNRLIVSDLTAAAELVQVAEQHETVAAPCAVCSVDCYAAMAAYYVAVGQLEIATYYTQQALQLADHAHNRLGRARVLQVQGQTHAAQGQIAEAETCLAEAADIFQELDDRYDLARTLQIRGSLPADAQTSSKERQSMVQTAQQLLDQFQIRNDLQRDD